MAAMVGAARWRAVNARSDGRELRAAWWMGPRFPGYVSRDWEEVTFVPPATRKPASCCCRKKKEARCAAVLHPVDSRQRLHSTTMAAS